MNDKKKIAELKAELKAVKAEKKAEIERVRKLREVYDDMEGMYGHRHEDNFYDPKSVGYYFTYDEGMKEKEDAEREAFWKENNLRFEREIEREYNARIHAIEDALSYERYGMSKEQRNLRSDIATYEEAIKQLEHEIEWRKKSIEEMKSKLI